MFRTVGDGPALRESLLPEEVLRLPQELVRVEQGNPSDGPQFAAAGRVTRRAGKTPRTGSEGRISTLKCQHGRDRTRLNGTEGA